VISMSLMLYSHLDLSLQIDLILKYRRLEFYIYPLCTNLLNFYNVRVKILNYLTLSFNKYLLIFNIIVIF